MFVFSPLADVQLGYVQLGRKNTAGTKQDIFDRIPEEIPGGRSALWRRCVADTKYSVPEVYNILL